MAEISVDDLARGAGISRPTSYSYSASEDAVLLILLDRVVAAADAACAAVSATHPRDPRERPVRQHVGGHVDFCGPGDSACTTDPARTPAAIEVRPPQTTHAFRYQLHRRPETT